MASPIKVDVFDIPAAAACCSSGCCGPAWSSEEITAIVREELERRFGDQTVVEYHNVEDESERATFAKLIDEFEARGLFYPVTIVDGITLHDGAVSYPAIMQAVGNKIAQREAAEVPDAIDA
jgi:disulfide oxidoreductase YuzD